MATVGLAVLSLTGFTIGYGEAITFLAAACYALHIIGLGRWSTGGEAWGLTVVQMAAVAVLCAVAALPGGLTLPQRAGDWAALVYVALVAGALALLVQTWAQAQLAPTRAAVIMTMEPVWAGAFAVAVGGEVLGWRVVVGGALVLAAMYLGELRPHSGTAPPDGGTDPPADARVVRGLAGRQPAGTAARRP